MLNCRSDVGLVALGQSHWSGKEGLIFWLCWSVCKDRTHVKRDVGWLAGYCTVHCLYIDRRYSAAVYPFYCNRIQATRSQLGIMTLRQSMEDKRQNAELGVARICRRRDISFPLSKWGLPHNPHPLYKLSSSTQRNAKQDRAPEGLGLDHPTHRPSSTRCMCSRPVPVPSRLVTLTDEVVLQRLDDLCCVACHASLAVIPDQNGLLRLGDGNTLATLFWNGTMSELYVPGGPAHVCSERR